MTVWVLRQVPSWVTFTVWWNCRFVPVSHSFALETTTRLQASAFQLAEQGDYYEFEGNCVNMCSIHEAFSWLIALRIKGINLLSLSLILAFEKHWSQTSFFWWNHLLCICRFPCFPGWRDNVVYLGRGCELLGANDLFTACVWNLFWLVGSVTCPLTEPYSLYFMWFHRCDETNKEWGCHTPSHTRQSSQPCRKSDFFLRLSSAPLACWRWAVTFSHKLKKESHFAQKVWCTLMIKTEIA